MTPTVSILKVYRYLIKRPGVATYKDLTLHLNPLLADNKDLEAARVSKFLNGNMKCNLGMLIRQFVQRRDAEKRETEAEKRPKDYLTSNLLLPCRCGEVKEKDGSAGCVIEDFEGILNMHGPHVAKPFIEWYTGQLQNIPTFRLDVGCLFQEGRIGSENWNLRQTGTKKEGGKLGETSHS